MVLNSKEVHRQRLMESVTSRFAFCNTGVTCCWYYMQQADYRIKIMITRRHFLHVSSMAVGSLVVSTGLAGCGGSNSKPAVSTPADQPMNSFTVSFDHGVASGDPLTDSVIIWTRATPSDSEATRVNVRFQVATDEGFASLVHDGLTTTSAERDFTIKIDAKALSANTSYYYRFIADEVTSPVGMTKTLPEGDVSSVKLAVFSCANYPAGHFNVYGHAATQENIDAVVHLGDYIYEYGMGGYATQNAEAIGRALPEDNAEEILSLHDYRRRYQTYRHDAQLQQLHAKHPFIMVWDDHEVVNDTWRDGAENHNEGEGDFAERKLRALQAYFEWMPIRPVVEDDQSIITRQFKFGDLVDLLMLDTRVVARDKQLDYLDYFDPATGQLNAQLFIQDVTSPSRALLGTEQLTWTQDKIVSSEATWQVLGQQILMSKMYIPAELIAQLANPGPQIIPIFNELAQIKGRMLAGDPTLTAEEIARVETKLPYNLDAWDGYPVERELVYGAALQANKNLVVLAGDTHNGWASNLVSQGGMNVGVEFATASVSSPGLEEYLSLTPEYAAAFAQGLGLLVDDLQYADLDSRGYMMVTFTPEKATSEWVYVDTILSETYAENAAKRRQMSVLPGAENRRLVQG